ncbi:MAG TPA: outer membrane lipoprotein carrier protein LolA [Chitinophagaceae bacterium]|jgi:outer membrane lipoprotein-sorting protein|nr:outer membrane lipoprotein carrier protein LolA [Chitinophagaceae bacterium]
MIKKEITLFLIFLFAVGQYGMAQPKTKYGQSDPQAKKILDAVSKKFKTYTSVKADFKLKIATTDNKVLDTKKGTVLLKGNKYHVDLNGQEVYCDGKTVWTYNKDTKEVQVNDYQPSEGSISPSNLFTNFYDKDFLYRLRATSKLNGRPVDVIEMTPLDKSKPYFKVIVLVDKRNMNLLSTEIFEKGGNRYTYEVSKFTPNASAKESDFVFDTKAHPGVEVVDLR